MDQSLPEIEKPGYREPITEAEQKYWSEMKPNYHQWVRKDSLTVDEATTLSMGLDPRSMESISGQETLIYHRFLLTKEWFSRNNDWIGERRNLADIAVLGIDIVNDSIKLSQEFFDAVDWDQDQDQDSDALAKIARLERQNARLEKLNGVLKERLVKKVINEKPDGKNGKIDQKRSAATKEQATAAKMIVALVASRFESSEREEQFAKLRAGQNTHIASKIVKVVKSMLRLPIDADTVRKTIQMVAEQYVVEDDGTLIHKLKDSKGKSPAGK